MCAVILDARSSQGRLKDNKKVTKIDLSMIDYFNSLFLPKILICQRLSVETE